MAEVMKSVRITSMLVGSGRLSVTVQLEGGAPSRTTPDLLDALLPFYPTLPYHTCINGHGPTFEYVMNRTSLPHLLEHLIIAEQLGDPRTPDPMTFVGTTAWVNESEGSARIEVNFLDDLIALGALQRAVASLERALRDHEP